MDVGAISFGHQDPMMMREAARVGGVDGDVSTTTTFKKDVNTLHS